MSDRFLSSGGGGSDDGKPPAKKRRLLTEADVGGPMWDEATAKGKLAAAGFDEGNTTEEKRVKRPDTKGYWSVTPIIYFCYAGDLEMCRYLFANGASTIADIRNDRGFWFPLYAAVCGGHLEVCKWLYGHGAEVDIQSLTDRSSTADRYRPLECAACRGEKNYDEICEWLILNGALAKDSSGYFDKALMIRDLQPQCLGEFYTDQRPKLLSWARGGISAHSSFMSFLMGTLADKSAVRSLNGTPAILEVISDYVGTVRGRDLRILRQLSELLPPFMESHPVPHPTGQDDSEEESSYDDADSYDDSDAYDDSYHDSDDDP